MNTKGLTIALFAAIIVTSAISVWLHLPTWIMPVALAGVTFIALIWMYRRAVTRPVTMDPTPDPADLERLKAACAAAGRADLEPKLAGAAEGGCYRVAQGQVIMSVPLLHTLTEPELIALVQAGAGPAADRVKQMLNRYNYGWLAALALVLLAAPFYLPALGLLSVIGIGYAAVSQSRWLQTFFAPREAEILRQERVDLASLVTGRAKFFSELWRTARVTPAAAYRLRQGLEMLAREAHVNPADLEEGFAIPLREYGLRWPTEKPPSQWKPLFRNLAIWLIILVVSVAVAMQLGNH